LMIAEEKPTSGRIIFPKNFRPAVLFQDFLFSFPSFSTAQIASRLHPEISNLFSQYWPLEQWLQQKFSTLSFSQQKLLAILATANQKSDWALLDEPFSALDDENAQKLASFLPQAFSASVIFQHQAPAQGKWIQSLAGRLQLFGNSLQN